MKSFRELDIPGVFEVNFFKADDDRGTFIKALHRKTLEDHGLVGVFPESFYSINNRGALRGMHFQRPPYDHAKLVYCSSGRLIDVFVDLREGSPTFGAARSMELKGNDGRGIYLPSGIAHGFLALEDQTTMVYLTSTMHQPSADDGIRYDSFGFEWPIDQPIMSERDLAFPSIKDLNSPFIYRKP